MVLFLAPLLLGAAFGWWRGGRLDALAALRFRAAPLVIGALAGQWGLSRVAPSARPGLVAATYAAVAAWIVLNLRRRPWPLRLGLVVVAAGWALNVAAIVPNGGMPVAGEALADIRAPVHLDVSRGHLGKHVAARQPTTVSWLGDDVPLRPLGAVVSLGDLVLAAGIALVVTSAMQAPLAADPVRS